MTLVKNIRRVHHKGKVHDLCVEGSHTYNVEGLAVHNSAAGSLVSYCLGLTDVDPIKYGLLFERFLDESRPTPPDIDTDFDPRYRDWVKEHIVEVFGSEHVCSIGTYQTYRTRAVILDVARALNEDVGFVNEITKKIDPLDSFENEDGEEKKVDKLSFDELCTHYPELASYFETHPTVRHHAEILRNQVKNMGTHAGGVIISDINLAGRIPLLFDKPGSDERKIVSAWAEAGGNEELSSVGLVKYDILGLNNLPIVSDCVELIRLNKHVDIKRWEIPIDDTDTIYRASKKDLHGIFQLDNPATKPVADAVVMESLDDVAAVTSLIRPGPRDMKMDIEYAERKHGKEYAMPLIIRNLLTETYGVITYQEQAMKIAQVLAGFPPSKSYKFLKAIAKKQQDLMTSFKAEFVIGSQKHVDAGEITLEEVESIWELLAAFAEYAFNKSVDKDELVWCNGSVKKMGDVVCCDRVMAFDGERMVETEVVDNHDHGVLPAFEVVFEGGASVVCSILHKFETDSGKVPLWKLLFGNTRVCHVATSSSRCVSLRRVLSARFVGFRPMCDLEVSHPSHNFTLANGIVTSNSHAITYSALSTCEFWLKLNYPTEYICSLINNSKLGKEKHGDDEFVGHINYARHSGIEVLPPDVNMSLTKFAIWDGKILFSIGHVKNVASMAPIIVEKQPYKSVEDFYERVKVEGVNGKTGKATSRRPNKKVVESLIEAGAFDSFGPGGTVSANRNAIMAEYYRVRGDKKETPPQHNDDEWINLEKETTGVCLSQPPLFRAYETLIRQKGWKLICEAAGPKKAVVFGKVESITPRTSKTGNPMYIVEITDGLDKLSFYVFKGAMQYWKDNFKIGMIAGIPLTKFDEGDTRFYDDKKQSEFIKKQ
jgi:DNA polymerase III alpha subunit